ncbi:MAG: DUF3325 domain-containing protein [Rhizobacter sp.]
MAALSIASATALGLATSYAGMAGLCLAMDRHHDQVWGRDASALVRRLLRVAGVVLLAGGFLLCIDAWGGAIGPVVWAGFLSAGALSLVLLLPYAPRFASVLAALAGAASVVAGALAFG